MEIELSSGTMIFFISQSIVLLGTIISWYIQHIRLKDKVTEMGRQCKMCKEHQNERFVKLENDVNTDLSDIKKDIKDLSTSFQDFKFMFSNEFTSLKTMITKELYK